MAGLSGLSGLSGPSGLTGVSSNWFVNANSGNDANSGQSATQPFQTIAALMAAGISEGDVIGLDAGSHWREQLTISADHVTVRSYGGGAGPLLDASDVIPPGSWAKTGGLVNVYETNVVIVQFNADEWVNVWEDDAFLTRVANAAACDAAPGSYYPTAESGAVTVYIHPNGSTDPTSDGKTYEVSIRNFGLHSTGQYTTLRSIRTRRNQNSSGSTRIAGRYATLINCHFDDGGKHNVYVQSGAVLRNCVATDAYFNASLSLYIFNEDTPAGDPVSFYDCTAQQTTLNASILDNGWLGHRNVGGQFGAILFDGCTAKNVNNGFPTGNNVQFASTTIKDCVADNILTAVSTGGNITINGLSVINSSGTTAITVQGAHDINVTNLTTNSSFTTGVIFSSQACEITLTNSELIITVNGNRGVFLTNAGATLHMHYTTFGVVGAINFGQQVMSNTTPTLDLDYNTYQREYWRYNNIDYNNLANWQAATGQDAHSTA